MQRMARAFRAEIDTTGTVRYAQIGNHRGLRGRAKTRDTNGPRSCHCGEELGKAFKARGSRALVCMQRFACSPAGESSGYFYRGLRPQLIPDFIPVVGLLDDAFILPSFAWLVLKIIPPG